jgi:hypothetical protein
MIEALIISLFGFPGAFLSLIITALGIIKHKYWLVLLGGILFTPFCLYLSGTPNFRWSFVLLLFHLGSAYAVYKNKNKFAWALFIPAILFTAFVLSVVLLDPIL